MAFAARRWSGALTGALLALGAATAAAQTSAVGTPAFRPPPGAYQFTFDVDLVGTPVVVLAVDLNVARESYDVSAKIKTVGMASWLFSWSQTSASQGAVIPGGLLPTRHRTASEFRGTPRNTEIDYAEGKVTAVKLDPVPRIDEISERQRAGTRDPVSAVIGLILAANQGQRCTGKSEVYDGRRRYDIVISELPAPSGAAVAATLPGASAQLACQAEFQPIAGELRRPRPGEDESKPRPNDKARVWMAPVKTANVIAPIRIEFDSWVGTMNVVLREGKFTQTEPELNVAPTAGPASPPPTRDRTPARR